MYIDTHCHLDDEKIRDVIGETVDGFLSAGVTRVINIGCDYASSLLVKKQAEDYPCVYFAAGFHPMDVDGMNERGERGVRDLLTHEKCVAVGEIGLDYFWRKDNKERQREAFIRQIETAYEYKLPVSIHVRDATGDALALLKENKSKLVYGGVMHCFSGSREVAAEALKLGLYIAFGGTLTFKNAKNALEVAAFVPEDMILTETDSPYLAPEPVRGTVNTPKNIPYIVKKLCEIRKADETALAERIMKNSRTLFYKLG